MTNLVPANVQIPAHLANRVGKPSALSQAITGGITTAGNFPRISIKGSRFRIVEDGVESVLDTTSLDIVIVGANPRLSKTFYLEAWTPDSEPSAPDCYSLDGVRPHPDSESPQNDLCATCPHNAWGSKTGPQGQKLKACADQKRLAIVSADDPTGPIYLLQVTSSALKGFAQYHKELSMRGIDAEIVKTKVSFDTKASFPKLSFSFGGFLDEETQNAVDSLFGTDRVKEITGEAQQAEPTPSAPVQETPAPQPAQQAAPQQAAPQQAAPQQEAPAPQPAQPAQQEAPKRGFGAKAQPAQQAAPQQEAPAPQQPTDEPDAAAAANDTDALADEIANLIGSVDDE